MPSRTKAKGMYSDTLHFAKTTSSDETNDELATPEERARARAKKQREFYQHLATYVAVIFILFVINAVTGGGWWFYWAAFGWGIGVFFHAFSTFFSGQQFDRAWEDRKAQELLDREQQRGAPGTNRVPDRPSTTNGGTASTRVQKDALVLQGERDVAELRANAARFTKPDVKEQAERICRRADQILVALAEPNRDKKLAHEFVEQVLAPSRTVFSTYVLLNERGITSAQLALNNVENHDLPVIERTLDDLHERLHREDVISLEVASEMLALSNPRSVEP